MVQRVHLPGVCIHLPDDDIHLPGVGLIFSVYMTVPGGDGIHLPSSEVKIGFIICRKEMM